MVTNQIGFTLLLGIFVLTSDMTSKFMAGFITGIFISTKYDFKPYVSLVEDKIVSFQREVESLKTGTAQLPQSPQPLPPTIWPNGWPWSKN